MVKKSSVANVAESALPIEAPSKTPKAFVIVGTPPVITDCLVRLLLLLMANLYKI